MPVEGFNSQLKFHGMKNRCPKDTKELHATVRHKARRIQQDCKLCRSF